MRKLLVAAVLVWCAVARAAVHDEAAPRIQVAVLLDTSNSMDGLIDQARGQLWKMVNELARARRGGKRPEIQVALYEYGNTGLRAEQGWVRRVCPLTTDLDRISEELFRLHTNGGDEYCGWVLRDALEHLDWGSGEADLRCVFIAGNEPFDQGPVDFHQSVKALAERGIRVSTIFCGNRDEGIATHWAEGAKIGGGKYLWIDQDHRATYIAAPQDQRIAQLGVELNGTYMQYGAEGREAAARQSAQDANAGGMGLFSSVSRAQTKASANYSNAHWDLVDALKTGTVKEETLSPEKLAEAKKQAARREEIQGQIAKLSAERETFLAGKSTPAERTLDAAMMEAVHGLARDRGFSFE